MNEDIQYLVVADQNTVVVDGCASAGVVCADDEELVVVTVSEPGVVAVSAPDYQTVSVGEQGPQGIPGPASGLVQHPAGVALGGHRAVRLDSSGLAIYADASDLGSFANVLGITTGAAVMGAAAYIQTAGEITEPSWNWTAGLEIYLGASGLLTQTPPTSGALIVIGFAEDAARIFIRIESGILL